MNNTAKFSTREEAQKIVDSLDSGTYYLAHGEYARPDYKVRKVRGEDAYYIRGEYFYYVGTFYARQDGPLSEEDAEIQNYYLES